MSTRDGMSVLPVFRTASSSIRPQLVRSEPVTRGQVSDTGGAPPAGPGARAAPPASGATAPCCTPPCPAARISRYQWRRVSQVLDPRSTTPPRLLQEGFCCRSRPDLEALRLQGVRPLEGGRRCRVVHHLEVRASHLAPHPACGRSRQADTVWDAVPDMLGEQGASGLQAGPCRVFS